MTTAAESTVQFDSEAERAEFEEFKEHKRTEELANSSHTVIEEDGTPVATQDINGTTSAGQVEVWKHNSFELHGETWEYRLPKPLAAMFLGGASRRSASPETKLNSIMGFLEHTLSKASMERLQERAWDHDDPFDVPEMAELVGKIAQAGARDAGH